MSTKNVTLKEKMNGVLGDTIFPATTTPNVYDSAKSQALSQTLVNTPDYEALGFAKFSTATVYNTGDKVYKDNGLYRFIADKTAGEWDVAKVEPWSIEQEIEEVDDAIRTLIPSQASADNKLADKEYVNDKVSTDTATFLGTFNLVTDLELTTEATQGQIATALGTDISGEDKNDYAFVQIPTSDATPTEIARIDRYKYTGLQWAFEYSLNNSGFTAEQWAAINSGITSSLVAAFGAKYDKPAGGIPASDMDTSTFDSEPTAGSDNLVKSGGVYKEISQLDQKVVEIGNSGNLANLDIVDENGNILARFSSGGIKTKNFDSSTTPKIDMSNGADFEVADNDNNVLLQLKEGHIKTKNFDSSQLGKAATHTIHFSFDDGEYSIIHLFANNYSSVWDSPFFGYLKTLHQDFGAVFTINLFISTFSVITNRYATELGAASSWLKFSLHGDKTQNYGESGGLYPGGRTSGGQDWTDMVSAVVTLTGTPDAIDRHTRLSNFAGTETNLVNMRDNKFGALCFSAADEYPRLSYDFDSNEEKYVWNNEFYFNSKTRLNFVRSYARLDDLSINPTVLSEMKVYIEQRGFSEFFIHEYSVYNSNGIVNAGITKLNAFFNFIHGNNYKCDFFKLTI